MPETLLHDQTERPELVHSPPARAIVVEAPPHDVDDSNDSRLACVGVGHEYLSEAPAPGRGTQTDALFGRMAVSDGVLVVVAQVADAEYLA